MAILQVNKLTSSINVFFFISLLIFSSIISHSSADDDDPCVYTVYTRTGSIWKGGTDSIISLKLYDAYGYYIHIKNLEAWGGLMEPGHNYFERGNLDIFSGLGGCLNGPVCAMNLTSDGTGSGHGWYVNYVEVTTTGAHKPCSQELFTVEQWLALDTSPNKLWAAVNNCAKNSGSGVAVNDVNALPERGSAGDRSMFI